MRVLDLLFSGLVLVLGIPVQLRPRSHSHCLRQSYRPRDCPHLHPHPHSGSRSSLSRSPPRFDGQDYSSDSVDYDYIPHYSNPSPSRRLSSRSYSRSASRDGRVGEGYRLRHLRFRGMGIGLFGPPWTLTVMGMRVGSQWVPASAQVMMRRYRWSWDRGQSAKQVPYSKRSSRHSSFCPSSLSHP